MTGENYRNLLNNIRLQMIHGVITYDEAKVKAQPIIDEMNKKGLEIAKKHGMRFKKFTFTNLMR